MSSNPLTDSMREGLLAKYPFMASPYFQYALLGVVILSLLVLFIWLKKRKV